MYWIQLSVSELINLCRDEIFYLKNSIKIKILINIHTYNGHDVSLYELPTELRFKCIKSFNFEHALQML